MKENKYYIAGAVSLLVGGIMMFLNVFTIDCTTDLYGFKFVTRTISMTMFGTMNYPKYLFALCYIAGVALMMWPFVREKRYWNLKYVRIGYTIVKYLPVISLIWFMLSYIGSFEMAEPLLDNGMNMDLSLIKLLYMGLGSIQETMQLTNLTIFGWLYLLDSFVSIALLKKVEKKTHESICQ